MLEAVLARGDRRQSGLLIRAYELGAKFDAWTESFNWDIWKQAFSDCGLSVVEYIRERGADEVPPKTVATAATPAAQTASGGAV